MSSEAAGTAYSPAQLNRDQVESLLRSAPEEFLATVYIDLLSNQPKNEATREERRQSLQNRFGLKLADSVERLWDLPPVILQRPNDEYVSLLVEAASCSRWATSIRVLRCVASWARSSSRTS